MKATQTESMPPKRRPLQASEIHELTQTVRKTVLDLQAEHKAIDSEIENTPRCLRNHAEYQAKKKERLRLRDQLASLNAPTVNEQAQQHNMTVAQRRASYHLVH